MCSSRYGPSTGRPASQCASVTPVSGVTGLPTAAASCSTSLRAAADHALVRRVHDQEIRPQLRPEGSDNLLGRCRDQTAHPVHCFAGRNPPVNAGPRRMAGRDPSRRAWTPASAGTSHRGFATPARRTARPIRPGSARSSRRACTPSDIAMSLTSEPTVDLPEHQLTVRRLVGAARPRTASGANWLRRSSFSACCRAEDFGPLRGEVAAHARRTGSRSRGRRTRSSPATRGAAG